MVCFLILCHIVLIVLSDPVYAIMASLASSIFQSVIAWGMAFCCSHIPLYAMACIRVASFAPWKSNSSRMFRFSLLGVAFVVPCFASLSLSLLPHIPWWPLTHSRYDGAVLFLRR